MLFGPPAIRLVKKVSVLPPDAAFLRQALFVFPRRDFRRSNDSRRLYSSLLARHPRSLAPHRAWPTNTRDCPRPSSLAASAPPPRALDHPADRSSSAHIPCPAPNPHVNLPRRAHFSICA